MFSCSDNGIRNEDNVQQASLCHFIGKDLLPGKGRVIIRKKPWLMRETGSVVHGRSGGIQVTGSGR